MSVAVRWLFSTTSIHPILYSVYPICVYSSFLFFCTFSVFFRSLLICLSLLSLSPVRRRASHSQNNGLSSLWSFICVQAHHRDNRRQQERGGEKKKEKVVQSDGIYPVCRSRITGCVCLSLASECLMWRLRRSLSGRWFSPPKMSPISGGSLRAWFE